MLLDLLPVSLRKYLQMSKRQRKSEMQMTLWYMPIIYIGLALFLVAATLFMDLFIDLAPYTHEIFHFSASVTRTLVSTLIGGILTLSAFTLNSLLVVLTTFSGQFSPRMLLNFISDKQTQHALGIFNGSFIYVLVLFLFIGSSEKEIFVTVPVVTIALAFIAAVTFIYFINHATTWMQVHNITYSMKEVSEKIIYKTLREDLEPHRIINPGDLMEKERETATLVKVNKSGYLQLVDYRAMIAEAKKDQIIIELHSQVGDYILEGNLFFSFWGPDVTNVDKGKYMNMIEVGHKETEIQDIQMGMHKLAEIAIKAIGNDDPKTASNTIHQMAELMLSVDSYITFSPYLADKNQQVRVIMKEETFEYYIYRGFGFIRHYAKDNHLIITEIVSGLAMVAESIDQTKHEVIWRFACNTLDHIERKLIYELDKTFLLEEFYRLAKITNHIDGYREIERKFYPSANENV
ncbi:DUF2254 domain-containing protein [Halobacillus amylolyticus]|uniref:DUF2254 domain-containing protein n=1 Tax=Halobacillus amylolyticus TaxID=2932259 RepID=A0ABY4H945_9BACI|nr:DUF2254 domain-containing protein [Halobacillus amylolyticus]UOR11393.1 DUF2254 domain-containing protein [Halobacillus amylolyticus]